ncbi:MAG TPA: isochorismatase family protein [Microlunatus sp.]|nr:isochorismatase family protein [Microlunatus sp.]
MTTLPDREARGLLVVDMQEAVLDGSHDRNQVVRTVTDLVSRARAAAVPVVWVQHHDAELVRGSREWALVDELSPLDGEPVIEKSFGDAFADTDLEAVLADRSVGEIVLVGAASEQCIRCTMHGAVVRGYDVSLVKGAHTTTDLTEYGLPAPKIIVEFMDSVAAFGMEWPGRRATSVLAADVGF